MDKSDLCLGMKTRGGPATTGTVIRGRLARSWRSFWPATSGGFPASGLPLSRRRPRLPIRAEPPGRGRALCQPSIDRRANPRRLCFSIT